MAERTAENRNQVTKRKVALKRKKKTHKLIDYRELIKQVEAGAEYFWSQPHREGIKPIKIDSNDSLFKWTSKIKGRTSFWQ